MKLIAGLGNIGEKYCFTRHNTGFMVLDKWASDDGFSFKEDKKLKCLIAKNNDILFIKPTTFMNLSGEAVRAVMDYYKISINDLLIIYDDISLNLGTVRFRGTGSDGGHNGIKSVIKHTGTSTFARLKIGIGPQPNIPSENYVLQNFPETDLPKLKEVIKYSVSAVKYYLDNGLEKAQNEFNRSGKS